MTLREISNDPEPGKSVLTVCDNCKADTWDPEGDGWQGDFEWPEGPHHCSDCKVDDEGEREKEDEQRVYQAEESQQQAEWLEGLNS